ncbi:MAG: ATP synthase F1 subunit gamma [Breznakibacter sp.]
MPNLKDIRVRIGSVKTTRQVTSAMKMVSAAKFRKAHDQIVAFRPYASKLETILADLLGALEGDFSSPFSVVRDSNRTLIVVITSNRGLCGAFNSNVVKLAERTMQSDLAPAASTGSIDVVAIGKQGAKMVRSHGRKVMHEFNDLYSHLNFNTSSEIAEMLMDKYLKGEYDKVVLVFNEFVNAASQNTTVKQFLPIEIPSARLKKPVHDFIYEPGKKEIVESIVPKAIKTSFYGCLLESLAAEHGARMTSMHKATDNASELLKDLQLAYNKARQTAITNEILEIVGGAEALNK